MNNPKILAKIFSVLKENNVKVYFANTSELKISLIIEREKIDRITNLLHEKLIEL